jgi:hypothetical protein
MRYLNTYEQLLEKKSEIMPFIRIFNTLPKSVDYRIVEWMIENWGDIVNKSPYGFSYYNAEKDWDYTEDKSLRLSDHWNFYSRATGDKIHCKIDIPYRDNEYWTIARYDKDTDTYNEEISFPYNYSKENRSKVVDIIKQYKQEYSKNFDYSQLNKTLNMLKSYINNDELFVIVLYYNFGEFVKEVSGKVNKLKTQKLSFQDELDETQICNFNLFTKSEMFFYDKDGKLLHHKKRNEKLN